MDNFTWEYRVRHLLANLGWVDFDLRSPTILPTYSATSANVSLAQTELGGGLLLLFRVVPTLSQAIALDGRWAS